VTNNRLLDDKNVLSYPNPENLTTLDFPTEINTRPLKATSMPKNHHY